MSRQSFLRLLIFILTLVFVFGGTYLMIRYAQGYRPTRNGAIKGTGLLAANSSPTGAEVYINGKLTSATDNTLNLDPGEYQIEIKKDGYHTWSKKIKIVAELVTQTGAQLFPTSPTLEPLTYTGAENVIPSPDGNRLVYAVASASAATKNGLYVQDLVSSPIALNKSARQIARNSEGYDYSTAHYTWSPNGSELLVAFKTGSHLLLDSTRFNDQGDLKDVTVRLPQILSEWELELAREERIRLIELPEFFETHATASGTLTNLYFSPDGEKLLYQALKDLVIPDKLIPPLPSSSTQPESRTLQAGAWYVYDLKEDRNFLLTQSPLPTPEPSPSAKAKRTAANSPTSAPFTLTKLMLLENLSPLPAELVSSPSAFRHLQQAPRTEDMIRLFNAQYSPIFVGSIQWYPDSSHLILTTAGGIDLIEYDGTNRTTVYSGPFDHTFVSAWPDYSRIITRIQFSPDTAPNLYTIKLK